jgi:hypothetical protein
MTRRIIQSPPKVSRCRKPSSASSAEVAATYTDQSEQDAGFAPATLMSADQALNDAATAEGLVVDDPRSHA